MDATIMVVAPGQPTANANAGTATVKDAQSSEFGQLLTQNMNVNDVQTQSDPNSQAKNLLQGAGQMNQLLLQIVGQQEPKSLTGESKVVINDKSNEKSSLNSDLVSALMQFLQTLGFDINKIQQMLNKQPKSADLLQLKANSGDANSIKGQVLAMFNKIINESANLGQFVSNLEQIIQSLTAEAGQSTVKTDQSTAKPDQSTVKVAVINELSNLLSEIKHFFGSTEESANNGLTGNSNNQNTAKIISTNKGTDNAQTATTATATATEAVNATNSKANEGQLSPEKNNTEQVSLPKVTGSEEARAQSKQNGETKETTLADNYVYMNLDNAKVPVNQEAVKSQTAVNLAKYSDTVFNQIVKKAEIAVQEGNSEMKIQLQPNFLGKVNMQIKIEEGVVTAKFAAENMQVKQMIEANLNSLRQNLVDQGLKVDQLSVSVGQGNDFSGYQQRQSQSGATGQNLKLDSVKVANEIQITTGQEIERRYGYSQSAYDYVV